MDTRPIIIIEEPEIKNLVDNCEERTRKIFERLKNAQVQLKELHQLNEEIDNLIDEVIDLTTKRMEASKQA